MKNLIILHGAIGAQDQFEKLKEILETEWNVFTMNFHGHGGLPIEKPYRIESFADQLEDFIAKNNLEGCTIFGYSMGGMVALEMTSRQKTKVEKIITLGTKFGWSPEIAQKEIKMLNADVIEAKIPKFAAALSKRHAPSDWKKVLENTAEMMIYLGDHQPINKETWSKIEIPVAICLADQDEMVSKEETLEVKNLLPNSTFTEIEESRHPIEQVKLESIAQIINN